VLDLFSGGLLSGLQRSINLCCGIGLHVRHQVAVDIHRDRDAMAEPLLHDLGMDVLGQHVARMAVAEAMQGQFPALRLQERGNHLGEGRTEPPKWKVPTQSGNALARILRRYHLELASAPKRDNEVAVMKGNQSERLVAVKNLRSI